MLFTVLRKLEYPIALKRSYKLKFTTLCSFYYLL